MCAWRSRLQAWSGTRGAWVIGRVSPACVPSAVEKVLYVIGIGIFCFLWDRQWWCDTISQLVEVTCGPMDRYIATILLYDQRASRALVRGETARQDGTARPFTSRLYVLVMVRYCIAIASPSLGIVARYDK